MATIASLYKPSVQQGIAVGTARFRDQGTGMAGGAV